MNENKNSIRKDALKKRRALSDREVREKSLLIKERLFELKEFKKAGLIMFYASFRNEVRTEEMIEEAMALGKKIAFPVTTPEKEMRAYLVFNLKKDLCPGAFGILEPKAISDREVHIKEIDMIIVPGVAFDRRGGRIGFGQGFYDRFLRSISPRPFCAGLGFEMQVLESLPLSIHDERLDAVITEKRVYAAN